MPRNTFEDCYIEMKVALDFAAEALTCWEIVSEAQVRPWLKRGWEHVPHLQSYLNRTSFSTVIIQLYKLLEKRNDTYNLYRLVDLAVAEGVFAKKKPWLDEIGTKLIPDWRLIKQLRHNFYAHVNIQKSAKVLLLETGLNSDHLRHLIDEYDAFLTAIVEKVGLRGTSSNVKRELLQSDLTRLTKALKQAYGS